MAAEHGYDCGPTLWVRCDLCKAELMGFGTSSQTRADVEAIIEAENWKQFSDSKWLCGTCSRREPPSMTMTEHSH